MSVVFAELLFLRPTSGREKNYMSVFFADAKFASVLSTDAKFLIVGKKL